MIPIHQIINKVHISQQHLTSGQVHFNQARCCCLNFSAGSNETKRGKSKNRKLPLQSKWVQFIVLRLFSCWNFFTRALLQEQFMVRSYRVERVVAWWQMWSALRLYLGRGLGLGLNHFFLGVWHEHPIFYTGIYFTSLKGTLISQSGWVSFKRSSWLAIKRMGGRCWGFEDVSFLSWWVLVQIKVTWTKKLYFCFCLFSNYHT